MTKQKFYEKVILKTYYYNIDNLLSNEIDQLSKIMEWPPESFNELILKRTLCGFHQEIPQKQQFDNLGFKYLAQVIGFVVSIKDDELTSDFFNFLNKIKKSKKIIDIENEDQIGLLYYAYYDTLSGKNAYKDFASKMADFILINCKSSEYHDKVLSLSYALGCTDKVGLLEIVNMKREKAELEPVKDIFMESIKNAI